MTELGRALLALIGLIGWTIALLLLAGCRGEMAVWPFMVALAAKS